MRQDGTDRDHAQLESAVAKEDKTAWDINRTYAHIAQALARGYTDLFHVNMDTEAFVEYRTDDDLGVLCESRRGPDFFASCARAFFNRSWVSMAKPISFWPSFLRSPQVFRMSTVRARGSARSPSFFLIFWSE